MKSLPMIAFLSATLFASPALAIPKPVDSPARGYETMRDYRAGSPEVISGGIGMESRSMLEAREGDFNTKLVFTGKGGMYLSDVGVTVTDNSGNIVFSKETDGPVLLTNLEPGQYTVAAEAEGHLQKQKIQVSSKNQLNTRHLRFPVEDREAVASR